MKVIAVVDITTNKLVPYVLDEMGGVVITSSENMNEENLIVTLIDLEYVEPIGTGLRILTEGTYEQFRKEN